MASTKFKPLINVTYTLKLSSFEGRPVESQFGKDQVLLRADVIAPAEAAGADLPWYTYPWVPERVQRAGIRAGEVFTLCVAQQPGTSKPDLRVAKAADATGIPESDLERDLRRSIAQKQREPQQSANVVAMPARPTTAPTVQTLASQALAGCLIAALDATAAARDYAAKHGLVFDATSEDIQGLASTLFIQISRMGAGFTAMSAPGEQQQQLVNGGMKCLQ
ncbi:MAG: hypothetical protein EPO02_12950 [Nitrospirae bacterium]|nr:MAG: hypothetical protein EPO02_12950 [Nitrospirota bacterium]